LPQWALASQWIGFCITLKAPRLFVLNEHVNDHQVGTAEALSDKNFVFIANNERELEEAIFDALACANNLSEEWASCSESAEPLIEVIKQFIDDA